MTSRLQRRPAAHAEGRVGFRPCRTARSLQSSGGGAVSILAALPNDVLEQILTQLMGSNGDDDDSESEEDCVSRQAAICAVRTSCTWLRDALTAATGGWR